MDQEMTFSKFFPSVFIGVHRWRNRFFLSSLAFTFSLTGWVLADGLKILKEVPSTYVYPADGFLPLNLHRATQTIATLYAGLTYDDPQGVACALLNSSRDPKDPLKDVVVTVVGVNSGSGELVYNVGLRDIRHFGSTGSGEGQFQHPTGVAIHPNGMIAVADTGNDRIVLLRHDGQRLAWLKTVGSSGKGPGQFSAPAGVAYDSHGNLYIADTGNNRIQVMDRKGRCRVLPTPPLDGPSAIASIDGHEAWTFYTQGPYANRLAVIDQKGGRLTTFTPDGKPLAGVTSVQVPDPPLQLYGCAFDYLGNVVATDFAKSCLRKFDKDLHYVVTFGSPGTDDFQFTEPRGIAIHHQFGQVLVSEKNSVQYFWNGADALNLKAEEGPKGFHFPFFLTEKATVDARILNADGNTVTVLSKPQDPARDQGPQSVDWTPDATVKKGDYTLRMQVMATYSSRERIEKELDLPVTLEK